MFEILAGLVCGMIVCAFGMWCFIHGQQNGIQVMHSQMPEQIKSPVQTVTEAVQAVKQDAKQDEYMGYVKNLVSGINADVKDHEEYEGGV